MRLTSLTLTNFKAVGATPVTIEFKPITLLFGPNSAGKSTVFQALHYLSEILKHYNFDKIAQAGPMDLGGFQNLVHQRDLSRAVRIRADFEIGDEMLEDYIDTSYESGEWVDQLAQWGSEGPLEIGEVGPRIKTAWVDLEIRWSHAASRVLATRYEVGINNEIFAVCASRGEQPKRQVYVGNLPHLATAAEVMSLNFFHPVLNPAFAILNPPFDCDTVSVFERFVRSRNEGATLDPAAFMPLPFFSTTGALPAMGVPMYFPSLARAYTGNRSLDSYNLRETTRALSQGIVGPAKALRDGLQEILYLGPWREIPARNYQPERYISRPLWCSGLAAWNVLHWGSQSFVNRVNEWLEVDRLNCGYSIRLKEFKELDVNSRLFRTLREGKLLDDSLLAIEEFDQLPTHSRVTLWDEARELELLPQDVGVGLSQVIPVIVAALYSEKGIVAIEQPELHVHPGIQVVLGDLFINQIRDQEARELNNQKIIFLIETHSEHLILRLLRRIRETHEKELPPGAAALSPDQIAVYYVEPGEDGVRIKHLRVDETGEFVDRWPKGFFEERAEELF